MKIPDQIIPDVYELSKKVYEKKLTLTEGSGVLFSKHSMNVNSARDYINNFKCLIEGREFKRTLNAFSIEYFIKKIRDDYGRLGLEKALQALWLHIIYYEGTHSGTLNRLRTVHMKYSKEGNLGISHDRHNSAFVTNL